tara:strand:- start:365 stop:583 length:219 start_codon:yes stop_codon:yes gene_type:complete
MQPGSPKIRNSTPQTHPFNAGDKVMHPSFGKGIVVSCSERGEDFEITVAFIGNIGIKRLLNSYAKLEKLTAE